MITEEETPSSSEGDSEVTTIGEEQKGKRYRTFTPDIELVLFNAILAHNPFPRGLSRRWMDVGKDIKKYMQNCKDPLLASGPYPSEYKCKKHALEMVAEFKRDDAKMRASTGTDDEVYDERDRLLNSILQLMQDAEEKVAATAAENERRSKLLQEGEEVRAAATRTESNKRPRSPAESAMSTGKGQSTPNLCFSNLIDSINGQRKLEWEDKKKEEKKKRRLAKRRIKCDTLMIRQMRELQQQTLSLFEKIHQENSETQREILHGIVKALEKDN